MKYKDEVIKAMEMLGQDERTIFIGQTVHFKGSAIFGTLEKVPLEKRIELPIMEDTQMGMTIGLGMMGYIPVSVYPRFDFMTLATNQLVNHLDKINSISQGRFNPKVIVRTMVGSTSPLNGGPQHTQDHTEAYQRMLTYVDVVKLTRAEDVMPAYERALHGNRPSLIVEVADLY